MEIMNLQYYTWASEIFLSLGVIILLVYGVIYSAIGKKVEELTKIVDLSILLIILTLIMNNEIINSLEGLEISNIKFENSMITTIKNVILITSGLILLMSKDVIKRKKEQIVDYEYTLLILLSVIGMILLIKSTDFLLMYLAIETISLSFYILAALKKTGQYSTEAGLKYFILGALSSGLLLFGIALIYISTGHIDFTNISLFLNNNLFLNSSNLINNMPHGFEIGGLFVIIALLFKLAVAPFHMWAPDVYEGSPTFITAYFAIVPKIAIWYLLLNLLYGPFYYIFDSSIKPLLLFSGVLSILIGSISAINQTKIKRLLAFSAVGHIGFIILALLPATFNSLQASFIYMLIYIIMSLNTFSFVLLIYNKYSNSNLLPQFTSGSSYIAILNGLSRKEPLLALSFSLTLLSIAGIPPLAGFFSKYLVLLNLINNSYIIISIIIILLSVIGCFYYIRLIQFMYFKDSSAFLLSTLNPTISKQNFYLPTLLILSSTLFFIITFIFYPAPIFMITFDSLISSFSF